MLAGISPSPNSSDKSVPGMLHSATQLWGFQRKKKKGGAGEKEKDSNQLKAVQQNHPWAEETDSPEKIKEKHMYCSILVTATVGHDNHAQIVPLGLKGII